MFEEDDLVFDQRTLEGLGNLYNSLVCPFIGAAKLMQQQWFIKNLQGLNRIEAGGGEWSPQVSVCLPSFKVTNNRTSLSSLQMQIHYVSHSRKSLQRIPETSVAYLRQFDELLASYESLAQTTLFTLRLELRCHVIYFLDQAIREGNFGLTEDEAEEEDLDPAMIELCKDLVSFEELLSTTLQSKEYK
jgi:exocyst complex component 4